MMLLATVAAYKASLVRPNQPVAGAVEAVPTAPVPTVSVELAAPDEEPHLCVARPGPAKGQG